jgi:hypothetical protein
MPVLRCRQSFLASMFWRVFFGHGPHSPDSPVQVCDEVTRNQNSSPENSASASLNSMTVTAQNFMRSG